MLSETAQRIFELKYAQKRNNRDLETWEQAAVRVADYVAQAEILEGEKLQFIANATKAIMEMSFIPGGRVLANAGTGIPNLMNCFVLPIEDSRLSIYQTLLEAAEIFAWGGGVGYNFSHLREIGAKVKTTGGEASGPVSFMDLFDTTGEVISQASRRGAQMGILDVSHPDILEFIKFKSILNRKNQRIYSEFQEALQGISISCPDVLRKILADNQLTHFNISVAVADKFMEAYLNGENWELISPRDGKVVYTIPAEVIMNEIAASAWENGDPGIFFIDTANNNSLAPYLGRIEATNPCGEVPLLSYEPCCLGSINLSQFVEDNYIDFEYLEHIVKFAVRFLDNVQEINKAPFDKINEQARHTRRLGLGVMGFADVLAEMGIQYDSSDAVTLVKVFGQFIQKTAWQASMDLARERGPFPGFEYDKINWSIIDNLELDRMEFRNIAVTSIAPTGTIALLAGVNSGIEPFFSSEYIRHMTEGVGHNPKKSFVQKIEWDDVKTSHDIHWSDHVIMQSEWQKYTDNAVSKTINMPNDAKIDDILDAITLAWNRKCKGITVYRDKSRNFQILNTS